MDVNATRVVELIWGAKAVLGISGFHSKEAMEWLECKSPVSIATEFLTLFSRWDKCVEYVKK
jgi:hypothetical protein